MGMLFKTCPFCQSNSCIDLTKDEITKLKQYSNGDELIQNVFPELPATEQEFLKTGMCLSCQILVFGSAAHSDRIIREEKLKEN